MPLARCNSVWCGRCAATAVLALLRMRFLVRRRLHTRAAAAAALLRPREQLTP